VRFHPYPALVRLVSDDKTVNTPPTSSELEQLDALVPKDVTARKRVLAALLRALNTDGGRG
jgi:hypothetical protein